MKSSSNQYGTVAVTIHWLSALLLLVLLGSGFRAGSTLESAAKIPVLVVHVSVGITVLVLTVLRILWWRFADQKPEPDGAGPAWQEMSARVVHILFYVVIIGMAASGIGMMVLSGAGEVLFGAGGMLPDFTEYAPRVPHGIGGRVIIALIVLHAGAALYHQFMLGDGTLRRMWFRRQS